MTGPSVPGSHVAATLREGLDRACGIPAGWRGDRLVLLLDLASSRGSGPARTWLQANLPDLVCLGSYGPGTHAPAALVAAGTDQAWQDAAGRLTRTRGRVPLLQARLPNPATVLRQPAGTPSAPPRPDGTVVWVAVLHPDPDLSLNGAPVPAGPRTLGALTAAARECGGTALTERGVAAGGLHWVPVILPAGAGPAERLAVLNVLRMLRPVTETLALRVA